MWYIEFLTSSPIQEHNFPLRFWIGGVKADCKSLGRKASIRLSSPNASRIHATLQVQTDGENEYLTVIDQSSYGTFLARADVNLNAPNPEVEKIDKKTPVRLNPGDRIAFGKPGAWYIVGKESWVVYADNMLQKEYYTTLKETCDKVGLTLATSWSRDISVVLFNELVVSPCLCLALINNIPIVHFAWIERVKEIVLHSAEQIGLVTVAELATSYTQLPLTESYFPRRSSVFTKEEISSTLPTDNNRKSLFSNKKFWISCNEQIELWESVIASAGGEIVNKEQDADYIVYDRNVGNMVGKWLSTHQVTLALLQTNTRPFEQNGMEEQASPLKYSIDSDAETDEERDSLKENFNMDGALNSERNKQQPTKTNNALLPCGVWLKRNRSVSSDDQMKAAHNNISLMKVSYPRKQRLQHFKRPKVVNPTISCNEMNVFNNVA